MTSDEGTPHMLERGKNYFVGVVGGSFPSNSDIGRGTKSTMLASSPLAHGQAWWVTDEGSWRAGYSGTSGQLYIWDGSGWILAYTPYTYPHPLDSVTVESGDVPAMPTPALAALVVSLLMLSCTFLPFRQRKFSSGLSR